MPHTPNRREILAGAAALSAAPALLHAATPAGDPSLKGRTILITGCSSGFGRIGALHYARLGAKVIATMRGLPRPEAESLAAEAAKDKLDLDIVEIDVTSDASVASGTAKALAIAGGRIDTLVNNAGIGITGPVEVQDMEATQLIFDTNVFGIQRMLRALLPQMRAAKGGQVFNISSQLGRVIVPGGGHYSATKFAVEALSEQMAYELVPHGIDVTVIQPGGYPTKVWVNRNAYTGALKARSDAALLDAYAPFTRGMGTEDGSGRSADPADVPRAIAEIMAMPAGKRPLRRAVHPGTRPQEAINRVSAEVQLAWLGGSPTLGPLVKAVHD
ncbi:SDR family oxidoreductase [Sphingopyxis alaskensis]|jgi:NAD(P)-dependent dehydrogenase (short-subunit alcohol dehydrogenase family)|uniref:Short-chain dehydrogenase/reductase SDR n=1 Tax=Sphingopyxis alaskensis (strain DSM 13593 / LMG 18877 / RB2256) TaxID=317655 RepID=Q1GSP0_SPHAL|nr:SDR family oxidoreductase [Sphingopyxis alaskensis]ABF53332.1 short-chain dehydrogenase/reductase SDR [Sphingopyxis alaskensis RB2256]MCM3418753.1 SDR family oxidoreductase [Sphingopyxis alaskensis]